MKWRCLSHEKCLVEHGLYVMIGKNKRDLMYAYCSDMISMIKLDVR